MRAQYIDAVALHSKAVIYSAPLGGQDGADAFGYEAERAGVRIRKTVEVELSINSRNEGEEGEEEGGKEAQAHLNHVPAYDPSQLARHMDAIKQSGCKTVVLILPEPDQHSVATAAAGGGRSQLYTAAKRL